MTMAARNQGIWSKTFAICLRLSVEDSYNYNMQNCCVALEFKGLSREDCPCLYALLRHIDIVEEIPSTWDPVFVLHGGPII